MTTSNPTPTKSGANIWYKNYMVTVFVIGLPLAVVIACIFFIIHAFKIKDTPVRDDWYMDGKSLYQDASKDKLAHDLGLSAVMRFDGTPERYEVRFELKSPQPMNYPATLTAHISHATNKAKDRDFTLTHTNDNVYTGSFSLDPLPAKYYLNITNNDGQNTWRLTHNQKLPAQNIVFLPLSAFDETKQTLPDQRDKRSGQLSQ